MINPPRRHVICVVAAGGALGAGARYGVVTAWPDVWATVAVNIAGCLLIGVILGWLSRRPDAHPLLRPFLATGVCGGFTTFSTFAVQTLELGGVAALAYVAATVTGALGAVWLGLIIGQRS
ncbi:fluoride efflux transporter FluC [Catenuloplanes japonicus]|uniref:fluoride efflux transporter FluC n=1 Tax=Catenuloplanes japonicus TaxID=33876 RepID=UPI0007C472F7|nr:CrcB family protein [Catenuloplanes japonicus]